MKQDGKFDQLEKMTITHNYYQKNNMTVYRACMSKYREQSLQSYIVHCIHLHVFHEYPIMIHNTLPLSCTRSLIVEFILTNFVSSKPLSADSMMGLCIALYTC